MKVNQHYILELEEDDNENDILRTLDKKGFMAECYDDGTIEVFGKDDAGKSVTDSILKELGLK